MNILFIDTSTNILTAGVSADGALYAESFDAGKNGHTKLLLSAVDGSLKRAGIDVGDLDAVCIVTGPGSFTGIRIGAATATAICAATGAKRICVTAFDLIAYDRGKITAAVEAGRGNLYTAECEDGKTVRTEFVGAEERAERERRGARFVFAPKGGRAETLAALAAGKAAKGEFADVFEPFYMRKSQAERSRDEI